MTNLVQSCLGGISQLLSYSGFFAAPKHGGHVLPSDYQSGTAVAKQDYLWNQITAQPYNPQKLPATPLPPLKDLLGLFNRKYLAKSFAHESDIMLPDRKKAIHAYGTVAKARFVPAADSTFTGLFQGAEMLVRASLAAPSESFTPGIGLKFFVDGQPSVNLFAMYSLDGQGEDHNFFSNAFTNSLPEPVSAALQRLSKSFAKVKRVPTELSASFLAAVTQKGERILNPVFSTELKFVPREEVRSRFNSKSSEDIRLQFSRHLKEGDALYDVYGADQKLLGAIVLTSEFVASRFGDEELFFQHHMDAAEAA